MKMAVINMDSDANHGDQQDRERGIKKMIIAEKGICSGKGKARSTDQQRKHDTAV
jgi:hypothetical protein